MKKQRVQLVILLIVLAALGVCYFGLKQYNRHQAQQPSEAEGETVIDEVYEDVVKFSYEYEGETYAFEKEEGIWYAAGDHSLKIKQYRIQSMLGGFVPFVPEQTIENVSDFSQYGLHENPRTISFETADRSYTIYVGDRNSVTNTYYVGMPSQTTIYTTAPGNITRFDVALDELLEETEETEGMEESNGAEDSEDTENSEEANGTGDSEGAENSEESNGTEDSEGMENSEEANGTGDSEGTEESKNAENSEGMEASKNEESMGGAE